MKIGNQRTRPGGRALFFFALGCCIVAPLNMELEKVFRVNNMERIRMKRFKLQYNKCHLYNYTKGCKAEN